MSCCWFLVFAGVWWLPLMMLVVAEEQQGGDCSAKKCGNVIISHPFWLSTEKVERPCGSLDFEVTCKNTLPTLRSSMLATPDSTSTFRRDDFVRSRR
ncbi:unnamed protein product [Triticum turgidum subsp. durum]|uniref:Wall-associated receptor kinase galacturonan-binding domain-containing protein n=1 Tax=Triticum turgidum subsp. durum TaxID=4567 RepID=A0A9R1RW95_TRITD|nr:unnamed protein product [Triticum turgidum subsp. durum]